MKTGKILLKELQEIHLLNLSSGKEMAKIANGANASL
jgi:hypothetical protein